MTAHMTAHCTSILCVMVGSAGPHTSPFLSPSFNPHPPSHPSPLTLPLSSSHSHSAAASMGLIDQEGPIDRKPTVGKYTSDNSFFDSYSEGSRHSYRRDEEPPSYSERQFGGYSALPKSGGSQGILHTHTHTHTHTLTLIHHILSSPSDQKFSKHSAFADNPQSYSSFSTKDPSPSSPSYTSYTSSTSSSSRGGNSTSSGAAGKFPYTGTGRVWHVSACIHSR